MFVGRAVPIARVPPGAVVEGRDVLEDRQARPPAEAIAVLVDELSLERVEEALGDGIVQAATGSAGAGDRPMGRQLQFLLLLPMCLAVG